MGFSPDWLALREPADRAARDPGLMAAAAVAAVAAAGPERAPVVMDLGCGTGATARAFAQLLPDARWRLVDQDTDLLALACESLDDAVPVAADLRDLAALPWDGVDLVTCSALLDLMPAWWVDALASEVSRRRLPFYAALSYDGVMHWEPALPEDLLITDLFNRHQRTDKGLGRALGPDAVTETRRAFADRGYAVQTADSPWRLGPDQSALHRELLNGIAQAAQEAGHPTAQAWANARQTARPDGLCTIGHRDLLAVAPVM